MYMVGYRRPSDIGSWTNLCKSEMSTDARGRGQEVAINCSSLLFGVALSYWVSFGFTRMTNQVSWVSIGHTSLRPSFFLTRIQRVPIAIQSIFSILSGASMGFLPDTPRWYYARDCISMGDKTLSRIYGVYHKGANSHSHSEYPEIQAMKASIMTNFHVEEESDNRLTLLSLIWDNTPLRVGRRVRISFLILSIQQSMGINMLVYYMNLIFIQVGLSDFLASLLAAVSLTVQWTGSLLCVGTIERIGRRRIMLFTACIETCCMIIFVVLNMIDNKTDATQWAAAMIMFPYLFFYGWGWVGCPWLYGPEVSSTS